MKLGRLGVIGVLLIMGCGHSSPEEKSAKKADNATRERTFKFNGGAELLARATYDLHCPGESMESQVLQRVGMFAIAVAAGVRGCGLQATYMRFGGPGGAWMLNGPIMQDPAAQQPPPGQVPPPPPPGQ